MQPMQGGISIRNQPEGLFNAMIAPLLNYPIKGMLWYQGESNASKAVAYGDLLKTLIEDWRNHWQQKELPFLYVQLPNFMEAKSTPSESDWATLRQQQLNTLSVPNTGMAVAIDVGEWNDIHPMNKKDVGHRLALQAERVVYKEKNVVASPVYQSIKKDGNKLVISFSDVGSGLIANKSNELKYFAIAGADKKFVWAKAEIKNNKVIVGSDTITDPKFIRYAWADNPEGANLYNKELLPASPFEAEVK
jgi:sialate O-acetylesterase